MGLRTFMRGPLDLSNTRVDFSVSGHHDSRFNLHVEAPNLVESILEHPRSIRRGAVP